MNVRLFASLVCWLNAFLLIALQFETNKPQLIWLAWIFAAIWTMAGVSGFKK